MRKLELQLQGVLACIKEALPAVSGLKIALGTYDDLARSGEITESLAQQAKHELLTHFSTVEIQVCFVILDELDS